MARRGINKVILIGNLGQDPDIRYTPGGAAVANVTIATNESWKDKSSGEMQEKTEWHNVVFFSRLAEIVGEYLKKGSQVYVEGRLQTEKWQDKSGNDRYTTKIFANEMQMLGSRSGAGVPDSRSEPKAKGGAANDVDGAPVHSPDPGESGAATNDLDDDIPF